MKVAEFYLMNKEGLEYSLMDINNYCWLTEPTGFGYSYANTFEQLEYTFIDVLRKLEQGKISGVAKFKNYDNYRSFIDFIENSEELKFVYKIPLKDGVKKTYYKDIAVLSIDKGYLFYEDEPMEASVAFDCLSLWYEETTVTYDMKAQADELRWPFKWDSKFSDNDTRKLTFVNEGHVDAPVVMEIDGPVTNPKLELYVEGELFQKVPFSCEIEQYEKFLYGTMENDFYVDKQNTDGTTESLFKDNVIDIANDNVLRIPKNKSCELRITADNGVANAKIKILTFYKAV